MIKTGAFQKLKVLAAPQESILVVTRFVFSSCDFVDRSFVQKNKDDPQSHTNQHEPKYFRAELDVTFEQTGVFSGKRANNYLESS
jgi:hypothetical protein